MDLAAIDPHYRKVLIKLYKISKFGGNRPNSKQLRYSHLKMSKFPKKCMAFSNDCIAVKTSLINTKLGCFVNRVVLFLTRFSGKY